MVIFKDYLNEATDISSAKKYLEKLASSVGYKNIISIEDNEDFVDEDVDKILVISFQNGKSPKDDEDGSKLWDKIEKDSKIKQINDNTFKFGKQYIQVWEN